LPFFYVSTVFLAATFWTRILVGTRAPSTRAPVRCRRSCSRLACRRGCGFLKPANRYADPRSPASQGAGEGEIFFWEKKSRMYTPPRQARSSFRVRRPRGARPSLCPAQRRAPSPHYAVGPRHPRRRPSTLKRPAPTVSQPPDRCGGSGHLGASARKRVAQLLESRSPGKRERRKLNFPGTESNPML
jgi:hypothetical protein